MGIMVNLSNSGLNHMGNKTNMNKTNRTGFRNTFFSTALAAVALISFSGPLHGSMIGSVDLGTSGNFSMLIIGGSIDYSVPLRSQSDP